MIEQKKKLRLDELQVESFVTSNPSRLTFGGGDPTDINRDTINFGCVPGGVGDDATKNQYQGCYNGSTFCAGVPDSINCFAATRAINCVWTLNVCTQSPEVCYNNTKAPV
jgi:hypothetical protein